MKKFKLFNILLILVMFFMIPTAYAHNVELDPDNVITIPLDSKGQIASTTKIEVNKSYGDYNLYYQYVKMNAADFEQYKIIEDEQIEYEEENYPSEDATNDEINDYKEVVLEYEASKIALKPKYVEENWITSTNGTVPFKTSDDEKANKGDPYVLWVKITKKTGEEAVYDEQLIVYNISEENEKSPQTSDNVLVIGILAVAAFGLMAVSYKKARA